MFCHGSSIGKAGDMDYVSDGADKNKFFNKVISTALKWLHKALI